MEDDDIYNPEIVEGVMRQIKDCLNPYYYGRGDILYAPDGDLIAELIEPYVGEVEQSKIRHMGGRRPPEPKGTL